MNARIAWAAMALCLLLASHEVWAAPPGLGSSPLGLPNVSPSILLAPAPLAPPPAPFAVAPAEPTVRITGMSLPVVSPPAVQAGPVPAAGASDRSPAARVPAGASDGTPAAAPVTAGAVYHLTLEDAKQRALANSKLLNLASLNVQSKEYATRAVRSDYFPKVIGNAVYLRFNDELGNVVAFPGRHVFGPRGRPLLNLTPRAIDVPFINQDTTFATVNAVQPITDLLKVRQGVKIAQADQGIAQAQLQKGIRELVSGVEQLYWGILAAQRIRAGALEGVRGAELLARTGSLEGRIALAEARQGLEQVDKQLADLQEQLNALLDLPLCTALELAEPGLPVLPYHCCDEVIPLALSTSPEVREAQQTVCKARAALCAGKLDYVPSIAVLGGFMKQTAMDYVQQDISYIGVVGSYTFFDGGKRRAVVREREDLVAMANLKLRQTEDDVRQNATKAFRELMETQQALKTAQEMVELRKEAEKEARTPEALRNPTLLLEATRARALAEVDAIKAELDYRQAYVKLAILIGLC